jgi:hypothetical protein
MPYHHSGASRSKVLICEIFSHIVRPAICKKLVYVNVWFINNIEEANQANKINNDPIKIENAFYVRVTLLSEILFAYSISGVNCTYYLTLFLIHFLIRNT